MNGHFRTTTVDAYILLVRTSGHLHRWTTRCTACALFGLTMLACLTIGGLATGEAGASMLTHCQVTFFSSYALPNSRAKRRSMKADLRTTTSMFRVGAA